MLYWYPVVRDGAIKQINIATNQFAMCLYKTVYYVRIHILEYVSCAYLSSRCRHGYYASHPVKFQNLANSPSRVSTL